MQRDVIGLIPGVVILAALLLAVMYWMYTTISVLSVNQVELSALCMSDKNRNMSRAAGCMLAED